MKEVKTLKGITVKQEAIEVEWVVSAIREDGTIAASTQFNRAYGQYDREQFLLDMAGEPTAATYADLAGLEVRSEQPVAVEPQPIIE